MLGGMALDVLIMSDAGAFAVLPTPFSGDAEAGVKNGAKSCAPVMLSSKAGIAKGVENDQPGLAMNDAVSKPVPDKPAFAE